MIELVVPVRRVPLIGDFEVNRVLPFRARRMIGPFVFLDEMGPAVLRPGAAGDVPPHPHIGLSTVTYLFEGAIIHRDSLGSEQEILPGDVNWMTAGRGIVHSERIPTRLRSGDHRLHGVQAWVALPLESEETEPSFVHYSKEILPRFEIDGVKVQLIAGSALGYVSPVKTHSRLFYFETDFPSERTLEFDPDLQEAAFYLFEGEVEVDNQVFESPVLLVFEAGSSIRVRAKRPSRGLFLGGEPLEGQRSIWWNFVSSSKDRIESAKLRWKNQEFPKVQGETEFVPLP